MFEPVRGGTRGGQAEFKWSDVSADKDRENYLGHSINAPTGRWQKNKDIHWYNRDVSQEQQERDEEIRKIKEMEADALAVALGFEPSSKSNTHKSGDTSNIASGSNSLPLPEKESTESQKVSEKEERRRRKAERKEEKRARKELRKLARSGRHDVEALDHDSHRKYNRSRSRSPELRNRSRERRDYVSRRHRSRSLSRSPISEKRRNYDDYNTVEQNRERERDRPRWDLNARRETTSDRRR
ncbi:kinase phosphorylation protein-domain-containing protein [Cyathus striatus]|nr:kinase phosphorylation protein-domain-containing protein [Cyathus striatus]